jgi:hypothetical protein
MRDRTGWVWPVVVAVALVAGFAANAVASSDDGPAPRRHVTVSGTATVTARPDEAVVDLGVRSEADDGAGAMEANATKMTAVLEALSEAGVARGDVETTRISLDRVTLDRGTANERTVYVARNAVQVTIADLSAAGDVIDAAVAAGADEVRRIRFQVSDPTQVHREALEEAVRVSRAKADAMAGAAGARVSAVVSITEEGRELSSRGRLAYTAALAADTPVVPPREVEASVSVTVVWSLV